jgi:small nuclear ribonucleoprotein (snRNP)-like protein
MLRDGRKLIGVLRSYDQFGESRSPSSRPLPPVHAERGRPHSQLYSDCKLTPANFLLESTIERLHLGYEFADVDIGELARTLLQLTAGVLLIRGENVVALGEIVSVLLTATAATSRCTVSSLSVVLSLLALPSSSLPSSFTSHSYPSPSSPSP